MLLGIGLLLAIVAVAIVGATRSSERALLPTATPSCLPVPAQHATWRGDMEEGALDDWTAPPAGGEPGGGPFRTGAAQATVSRGHAHTGSWSAKLTLATGQGGARLFRWSELRAYRHALIRVWLYIPKRYRPSEDARSGRFWNILQFKSRSVRGANDPLWFVNAARSPGGRLRLQLIWWHRTLEGPRSSQSGFRRLRQQRAHVPVGRWFEISAEVRQSNGFDGQLCVWQGDRLLFALDGVRTSYRNCAYNSWCTSNEWSVNNYSDGLRPAPVRIYADDASVDAW